MNYYIKYFGCDMNKSDAQRICSVFDSMKFKKTENIFDADAIIILA